MSSTLTKEEILKGKIMIVDDSTISRRKLALDLQEFGFKDIIQADCAEKALELVKSSTPDLFLIDMLMPGMDGNELVEQLRLKSEFTQTPIIIVTVSEEKGLIHNSFEVGVSDFLRKPWDKFELAARVKAHIERNNALKALTNSELRFTQAMQASREGLWEYNIATGEMYFSLGYYRMLGYEQNEFPASFEAWKNLLHPDDLNRSLQIFDSSIKTKRKNFEFEFRLNTKAGAWCWISSKGTAVEWDNEGNIIRLVGVHEDITAHVLTQKTLQKYAQQMEELAEQRAQALVHSERLATIGTMSAGIAHEINNPLTYISGNSQLLSKIWPDIESFLSNKLSNSSSDAKLAYLLEQMPGVIAGINKGVSRISQIVKSMKSFSRKECTEMTKIDITEPIENALILCNSILKKGITVHKNYSSEEILAPMRHQQIEQVLINLINNAAQAMNGSGDIFITTQAIGDFARIIIRDSGNGIPKDILKKIFDPFFTTKEEGVGTGLGLSISRGIFKDHGGEIEVCNSSEGGAEFTLLLPLDELEVDNEQVTDKGMRVLLIEDDKENRRKLAERLRVTGCHVLHARDEAQAMQHIRYSNPHAIAASTSKDKIKNIVNLINLHNRGTIKLPLFLISYDLRERLEESLGKTLGETPLYETITSQVIGAIFTAASNQIEQSSDR